MSDSPLFLNQGQIRGEPLIYWERDLDGTICSLFVTVGLVCPWCKGRGYKAEVIPSLDDVNSARTINCPCLRCKESGKLSIDYRAMASIFG